ncbi:MAG: hypothetical protein Q6363_006445, partial [Candidatus Njordarchaeota archaeon]
REVEEIRTLIDDLSKYNLEADEANILGVANVVLWEVSGDEAYFEKGIRILEEAQTEKAKINLAIAYTKYAARLLDSGADFKEVKKYALLAKQYAKS